MEGSLDCRQYHRRDRESGHRIYVSLVRREVGSVGKAAVFSSAGVVRTDNRGAYQFSKSSDARRLPRGGDEQDHRAARWHARRPGDDAGPHGVRVDVALPDGPELVARRADRRLLAGELGKWRYQRRHQSALESTPALAGGGSYWSRQGRRVSHDVLSRRADAVPGDGDHACCRSGSIRHQSAIDAGGDDARVRHTDGTGRTTHEIRGAFDPCVRGQQLPRARGRSGRYGHGREGRVHVHGRASRSVRRAGVAAADARAHGSGDRSRHVTMGTDDRHCWRRPRVRRRAHACGPAARSAAR